MLLVFANKQDLPNAMSAAEITDKLHLNQIRNRQVSIIEIMLVGIDLFVFVSVVHTSYLRKSREWVVRGFRLVIERIS